jgi:hypothetical protein
VLQKRYRIYNFKALSGGNRRFCSTTEMPKFLVFQYFVSLGIRFFEPGGQGFESLRAHFSSKFFGSPEPRARKRADRTPDEQQDGSTTRRRAGLDVAAFAAAVRSEAEDERRSREQSGRAFHSNLTEATN